MQTGLVDFQNIRKIILRQSRQAGVGHIGSSLSVADILSALYGSCLHIVSPDDPDRDRFVLSKGHASLALYAALYLKGWLSQETLDTYCQDNTLLGVHPEHNMPGIDFSTGSLGMGFSYAAGAALAARLQNSARRVFALVSDGECDEGIIWETAMFAAHHRLANLYIIIDLNGQQALGYTRDVLDLAPMTQKWQAFGWDVHDIDGNSVQDVIDAIETSGKDTTRPHAIIAHTTFGKGVSFMENQIKWHYMPLSGEEYQQALSEIEASR